MRRMQFDECCRLLASERGGYTLWIGAGAAMAQCTTALSWAALARTMAEGRALPSQWEQLDFPARLEWLAGEFGHLGFRSRLRNLVVSPMLTDTINKDVVRAQAVIGMRAGTIASFNIEAMSAVPFAVGLGGNFVPRPYLPDGSRFAVQAQAGMVCTPVFFPHGLLDLYGACVLTKSEYTLHGMSLAVGVAVNLCLGGDLVIMGMSLGDTYLREAILQNRRWIRDIFWIGNQFEHLAWAEVASVYCVEVAHDRAWGGLAEAILDADARDRKYFESIIRDQKVDFRDRAVQAILAYRKVNMESEATLNEYARSIVSDSRWKPQDFRALAAEFINRGLPIPAHLLNDFRYDAPDT